MNRRAFTLIEALATLLLIAIVIPPVLGAMSVATRSAGVAGARLEATMLAEAKLDQIIATRQWEDGSDEGDFAYTASDEPLAERDAAGPAAYRWELLVEDGPAPSLRQLRLRVLWHQRGHEHALELVTLVSETS